MFKCLLSVLFISCFITNGFSQMTSNEAIDLLKNDGLVVRVNCHNTQLDTMKSLLKSESVSELKKAKLKLRIESLESESRRKASLLMQSFEDHFNFCEVYFVPDHLFKQFTNGERQNIFLNKDLELYSIEKNISNQFVFAFFPYSKFRPLRLRQSKYNEMVSDYALILPPFPEKSKSSDIFRIFRSQSKQELNDIKKTISGFNQTLHRLD